VIVLEAKPSRPASVESVPITAGRRLRDVSGTIDELREQVETLGDAFLRVTVKTEALVPGLADRVKELLPNALDVKIECVGSSESRPGYGRGPRSSMDPLTLFGEYYRRRNEGRTVPRDLEKLFVELLEEASR